ncbi:helix-turn-helix domain-containing protein [Streptomyces bobili]|uniref:helix-turn-helix domain-containing protein n=1 Tax=Streptomyces bobili TaxID=67280 RepID=UPI002257A9B2|nr:helix-turn-helix transcriptional regulator [Streptomyces bobili]MCX5522563.1 helix-turn-helix domain-containing protein [Streptomyces bobili]
MEPSGICHSAAGLAINLDRLATIWVLTQDHERPSVCEVSARRSPRPDWVIQRRIALGHRIADLRRQAELSQEQLAHLAGMERRSIQRYENAQRDPQFSDLLLIAHALRVPVADLLAR